MYPFEQRKINFPLKIFRKFFYEKIPEWCPEGTGITTSLHAFWIIVLRGVKFSNMQKCSTPFIFSRFFFLQKYFNDRSRARKYREHCIFNLFYADHDFWELTWPKLTLNHTKKCKNHENSEKSEKIENFKIKSSWPKIVFLTLGTQKSGYNPEYKHFVFATGGSLKMKFKRILFFENLRKAPRAASPRSLFYLNSNPFFSKWGRTSCIT